MIEYDYLVVGRTGEYEDECQWFFGAFDTEREANEAVLELNYRLQQAGVLLPGPTRLHLHYDGDEREALSKTLREQLNDEQFNLDYTGARYDVEKVRFFYDASEALHT